MMTSEAARLSNVIAPSFYGVHWDIQDGLHTYYDLYGGRGSTKSSFISVEIILGIMDDPQATWIPGMPWSQRKVLLVRISSQQTAPSPSPWGTTGATAPSAVLLSRGRTVCGMALSGCNP